MGYQTKGHLEWTAIMGGSDCIGCLVDIAQAGSMNCVLLACWSDLYDGEFWPPACVGSCDDFFYCLFRSDGESDGESEEEVEEESEEEESEDDYETRTAQASMCAKCA